MFRNIVLAVAMGLQQTLAQSPSDQVKPKIIEVLNRFTLPIAVVAVDALVSMLTSKDLPPIPSSPNRTSTPDTSVYPAVKFFVKDHLGNVRIAYRPSINDTTCLVQHELLAVMDYSPYGALLRSWFKAEPAKWQSTGHERDWETGWDFRGARLYDASYGRFLSRDPLGGMFPSWSPYNYVLGNPVSLTDPSGMSPDGGGRDKIDHADRMPVDADAAAYYIEDNIVYVRSIRGPNSWEWNRVDGITITAQGSVDIATSI